MGKVQALRLTREEKAAIDNANLEGCNGRYEGPPSARVGYVKYTSSAKRRSRNSGDRSCYFADGNGDRQFGRIRKFLLVEGRMYVIVAVCQEDGTLYDHLDIASCPAPLRSLLARGLYAKEYHRIVLASKKLEIIPATNLFSSCLFVTAPEDDQKTYAIRLPRHYCHD